MWDFHGLLRGRRRVEGLNMFDLRDFPRRTRSRNEAIIRRLCTNAYLGRDTAICRVLGRFKMFVDTRDTGLSVHLLTEGYWEMWLTEALADLVKPGMVAVDIGANLGYFTLLMAELVGKAGAVHAFEPNPAIADRLAMSIDINGFAPWVALHRDPLGSEEGTPVALAVPASGPLNAYITTNLDAAGAVLLTTRRFDAIPDLMDADIIKIDAEGAELDIWRGMSGFLDRRAKPLTIFMEFASSRYRDPEAFLGDIESRGFTLAEVTLNGGVQTRTRAQILSAPSRVDQMLALRR